MACFSSSSCLSLSPISALKIYNAKKAISYWKNDGRERRLSLSLQSNNSALLGQQIGTAGSHLQMGWCFVGGLRVTIRPKPLISNLQRKSSGVYASWLASSQIASTAFTLGTAAVLPFYGLMVLAPKAALTKASVESNIPYIVLGLLYAYLLYLSWTPETMRLLFASQYWLPELPGMAKMFSNEMTLASAWIHLLVVDLFAARQVYRDGLEDKMETRHSISLCLFFCPVGILTHVITKALTKTAGRVTLLSVQLDKFKSYDFGRCPRVYCCGQPCLPVGQSDIPRSSTVKIYCPKCEDIYYPRSKYQDIDGAYFGTTFPHLFLMTYGHLKPQKPSQSYMSKECSASCFTSHDATISSFTRGPTNGVSPLSARLLRSQGSINRV